MKKILKCLFIWFERNYPHYRVILKINMEEWWKEGRRDERKHICYCAWLFVINLSRKPQMVVTNFVWKRE